MGRTGEEIMTGHNRTDRLVRLYLHVKIESYQIQLLSKRSQIKAQPGEIMIHRVTNYREQKDSASQVGWGLRVWVTLQLGPSVQAMHGEIQTLNLNAIIIILFKVWWPLSL